MITLIHATLMMFILKGFAYFFFPKWIKQSVAENIIELSEVRLKWLGFLAMFVSISLWLGWARYL